MSPSFARRFLPAFLSLLVCMSTAPSVAAQSAPRVTLAIVHHLADSAVATIVRLPGANGRTLVLLREDDANEVTLASAMMALYKVRHVLGDTTRSRLALNVYGRRPAASLLPNEHRLAGYYLGRLRTARAAPLESFGTVKAVDLAVAPLVRPPARLR